MTSRRGRVLNVRSLLAFPYRILVWDERDRKGELTGAAGYWHFQRHPLRGLTWVKVPGYEVPASLRQRARAKLNAGWMPLDEIAWRPRESEAIP